MKRLSITGVTTAISLAAIPIAISFQLVISPLPSCIQLENVSKKCKRTCCFSFFVPCLYSHIILDEHTYALLRSRNIDANIAFKHPKA